ncbi:MAG: hypothetical protein AAFX95_19705 [Cyanobacteria bacterium J06639_16]
MSDFRNTIWDPQVTTARKITAGPVKLGSVFTLESSFLGITFELPYTITIYEPAHRFVVEGKTSLMHYQDEVTFVRLREKTQIIYDAQLTLMLGLRIFDFLFQGLFRVVDMGATLKVLGAVDSGG